MLCNPAVNLNFFLLQVKHGQEKLLSHPLVQSLIFAKWRKFGRAIYYSKLCLFILFLFFLTGYTAESTPLNPKYQNINGTLQCVSVPLPDTFRTNFFVKTGKIFIVVLAGIQLLFEVSTLCFLQATLVIAQRSALFLSLLFLYLVIEYFHSSTAY